MRAPLILAGNRCARCAQQDPPAGHEAKCSTWHRQMADAEKAAKTATKLTPSYPVTSAQAIDLLAHLGTRGFPAPELVVQLVLDLGWRPFQGALAVADASLPDPGGTGDLLDQIPGGEA